VNLQHQYVILMTLIQTQAKYIHHGSKL